MRYLSRIIKSAKVSLGKQMELDSQVVIKTSNIITETVANRSTEEINNGNNVQPVKKTQEEIEAMYIEEAQKKSELFFDTEMQRAYSEGMEKAMAESNEILENARIEAQRIIQNAIQLKNNIEIDYKNTMEAMEKDIMDLVLEVAEKVIAKEIKKPDYIVGLVAEAVDKAASKKDTILKVSEEDYEFIVENKDKILLNVEGFGEVEIVKEASLERGSCMVETNFGIIDGGIKTRMKQIEREVGKILNR